MIDARVERRILRQALSLGERAAESEGLVLHSIAIGLPSDPPFRVRFSMRDPESADWSEPALPGWMLATEVREFLKR